MSEGVSADEYPFFPLRAVLEFDPNYQVCVGRCLNTGSVATADDMDTAESMLMELLQDEIEFAVEHKNFTNLFSAPASPDVWAKWANLAAKEEPKKMYISITAEELKLDKPEIKGEISVVRLKQ